VGKEKSRFRVFTKKQREKFFEVYRNAAIYPHTGLPSVNEVAHKCKLAHKTVKRLRDDLYETIDSNGNKRTMLDLKPAEVIALDKHAELLRGDPDSRPDMGSDGKPIRIILNLGNTGMIRENGKKEEK
jgi:hypothetical protein